MGLRTDLLAGRYRLGEELGAGSMGRVYRAEDTSTRTEVAVKLLQPLYAHDATAAARLRREAQLVAMLDSTHIVRLVDAGVDDDRPFLVMEYLPGPTLAEELQRRQRFAVCEALAVLLDVARALEVAHHAGIVHRDLKPGNIKLTGGHAKVMDFGIARAVSDLTLTATGTYMGTPAYSAPERTEGKGDIRSDIYSAGLILYALLAGSPPFTGANPWAILNAHRTLPVPPLPVQVPETIQTLLARCLAKAPADRFQTPDELVAAAIAVQAVMPVPPLPLLTPQPEPTPTATHSRGAPHWNDDETLDRPESEISGYADALGTRGKPFDPQADTVASAPRPPILGELAPRPPILGLPANGPFSSSPRIGGRGADGTSPVHER